MRHARPKETTRDNYRFTQLIFFFFLMSLTNTGPNLFYPHYHYGGVEFLRKPRRREPMEIIGTAHFSSLKERLFPIFHQQKHAKAVLLKSSSRLYLWSRPSWSWRVRLFQNIIEELRYLELNETKFKFSLGAEAWTV